MGNNRNHSNLLQINRWLRLVQHLPYLQFPRLGLMVRRDPLGRHLPVPPVPRLGLMVRRDPLGRHLPYPQFPRLGLMVRRDPWADTSRTPSSPGWA